MYLFFAAFRLATYTNFVSIFPSLSRCSLVNSPHQLFAESEFVTTDYEDWFTFPTFHNFHDRCTTLATQYTEFPTQSSTTLTNNIKIRNKSQKRYKHKKEQVGLECWTVLLDSTNGNDIGRFEKGSQVAAAGIDGAHNFLMFSWQAYQSRVCVCLCMWGRESGWDKKKNRFIKV